MTDSTWTTELSADVAEFLAYVNHRDIMRTLAELSAAGDEGS